MAGKIKINSRVRKRELYVSPSDKGKGVVVMPLQTYAKMVKSHTGKDREVKWQDLEEAEKLIRSYARSLGKILKIGEMKGIGM